MNESPTPMSFAERACSATSVFCLLYAVTASGELRAGLLGAAIAFMLVALCMGIARWRRSRDG